MAKLTLTDLTQLSSNETSAVTAINANGALIEAALEKTLSRDGTTPNTMSASLDMNSQAIINLPAPSAGNNPVTKTYGDANYGGTAATTATTKASEASASATAAATSATAAATSASTASGHKDTASYYAVKVDGAVTGSDFSSKAWAIGGTNVTTTASRGAAKEWATTTGGAVDTSEYSAKEYAIGTTVPAGSAKDWAIQAEDSAVTGSSYSALHWAAKASGHATTAAGHAKGWAAVTTLTNGSHDLETTDAKDYYIIDASSGTVTINLPSIGDSDGLLYGFEVKNVDNAISIVRDGSDRINSAAANYSGLTTVGQVIHFISDNATPDNWLATIISQTGDASATVKGIVELATDAEAIAGSDSTRAITPANLAATFPTIRLIPQNSKSADYTLVLTDAGKHIYHPGSDTSTRTWTIPANSSVAYTIGTAITFVNDTSGGAITIAITSDTLVLAPDGTTGSRTLAANGMATAIKMTSTRWMISGSGLT